MPKVARPIRSGGARSNIFHEEKSVKKCREVMTGDPVCCVPTDTVARIAKLMKTENIGSVPICEDRHG
ncbi:MAG: CBS domain-containing protein, partial [Bryobacteraceae bacterium]